jgi:hypothetical protein
MDAIFLIVLLVGGTALLAYVIGRLESRAKEKSVWEKPKGFERAGLVDVRNWT